LGGGPGLGTVDLEEHQTVDFGIPRRPLMSASTHVLTYVATLTAFALALGTFAWRVSRAVLLY